jgi:DNA repair exonuclease SbcCD ATPase subunit
MMCPMSLDTHITYAEKTAANARSVREEMRWRQTPGSAERQASLRDHLHRITMAMAPLRSAIGKLVFGDEEATEAEHELRAASKRLQYERKQLNKMLR